MTTETKHGQWVARSRSASDGALVVMDAEFNEVCVIREQIDRYYGDQDKLDIARASLLASAPDLLAALEHSIRFHDQLTAQDIERYRAAIRKAKGES